MPSNHRKLSWLGHLFFPGLFAGRHEIIINDIGSGAIIFIHREEFSGLLVPLLWTSVEKSTRSGFALMNQALKKRVEAISGKDPTG